MRCTVHVLSTSADLRPLQVNEKNGSALALERLSVVPMNFAAVQLWAAAISSGEGEVAEARREAVIHKTAAPANEDSTFVRRDIDRFSSG